MGSVHHIPSRRLRTPMAVQAVKIEEIAVSLRDAGLFRLS